MIQIDGARGEGGGQVLRTALALSVATGRSFCIENIRAGRGKPGLRRQHLAAVRAAAAVGEAVVEGDALGSARLRFAPAGCRPGRHRFSVGSAGSATLVLQTVLPALCLADGPSSLVLEGGTHNPWAPPFDFLDRVFVPLLSRMGPRVTLHLERCGFYPAGGGRFRAGIEPVQRLAPLALTERGAIEQRRVRALLSRLPRHIAEREIERVLQALDWEYDRAEIEEMDAAGPGNVVLVECACRHVTGMFCGFGRRGVPAEKVADEAAGQARAWLAAGVPVGPHLADQLMVPMALAGGGRFTTLPLTRHATTNLEVIDRFVELDTKIEANTTGGVEVAFG